MMALLIEELYDNFILMSKLELDLIDMIQTTIYAMYYTFAEFNSL